MNSFDVFDTLIARRYIDNAAILNSIETEFSVPGFIVARTKADNGQRSLSAIYDELVSTGVLTAELAPVVLRREIDMEIQLAIPIKENIDRVKDGDLLISDMYLPAWAIREMTRAAGLKKQVTIYQSNGDKSNGKIWQTLISNKPGLHLGDNLHSDVTMAKQYGYNAEHYPGTAFNEVEGLLVRSGLPHIALLTREIRLRNFNGNFFAVANTLNLPWLFVTAEMLHRKHGDTNIVFLGRDCQLLQQIYATYYGTCSYLPFSRKVAFDQPVTAIQYLAAHTPEDSVLFDVISTGGTWEKLEKYANLPITVAIYSNLEHYTATKPKVPPKFQYLTKNDDIRHAGFLLEVMNCADHGHLDQINQLASGVFTSVFGTPELDANVIAEIHQPVKDAVTLQLYKPAIRAELSKLTDATLHEWFKILVQNICGQSGLNQHLTEFYKKEFAYLDDIKNDPLTALANKYCSDKGTTYKCAHGYTEHYNKIFKPFKDSGKEFKLLEVGLNRDNQNSMPSMQIYREFFGQQASLYGFDIHPGFKKFHDPGNKQVIYIGDQSSATDLGQCTDAYDIIIDDGYHASKHQQITLLALWDKLVPGGIYVIEDLHYQPEPESDILTKDLLRQWKNGVAAGSTHVTSEQIAQILVDVDRIEMFDSKSKNWPKAAVTDAFAIIYKK